MNSVFKLFLERCTGELESEIKSSGTDPCIQAQATFKFLSDLASGIIPTTATHVREYLRNHAEYKRDSELSTVGSSLQKIILDDLTNHLLSEQNHETDTFSSIIAPYILEPSKTMNSDGEGASPQP